VQSSHYTIAITYPCRWGYRVIGSNEDRMRQAIDDVMPSRPYDVHFSNRSSQGAYLSLNVEVTVSDETDRLELFGKLKRHPDIRLVL
jgi:putative lipoic acid-binding regulatory protein